MLLVKDCHLQTKQARKTLRQVIFGMDHPVLHGKPKVVIIEKRSINTYSVLPPGPDYIIIELVISEGTTDSPIDRYVISRMFAEV